MPAAASALLNNAFRVIDQYAAGSIGTPAQAAIGSCTFVLIGVYAVYCVVSAGTGPLFARATGARDERLRREVLGVSLVASQAIGVAIAVVVGGGAELIAAGLGLHGETAENAATFLRWLAIGGLPLAAQPVLDAVFVAMGRTGLMMTLQVGAAVLNVALNLVLIPRMGVAGAALATCLARALVVSIGLAVLWREVRPTLGGGVLPRILRVGAPISVNMIAYAAVYALLLRTTISPLGPAVNAALGIGFSALEGVTYPLFLGVSLAVSSIVGRQLGAGRPDEAARAARVAFPVTTALGLGAGALFWFGAGPLCAAFTDDPAVLDAAITYARVLALSQIFVAWEALAEGVLAGAGDTRTIFLFSAPMNALRVPLGWALAFPLGWGAAGVWWAINLTSAAKALGKGWAARRGAWARVVV